MKKVIYIFGSCVVFLALIFVMKLYFLDYLKLDSHFGKVADTSVVEPTEDTPVSLDDVTVSEDIVEEQEETIEDVEENGTFVASTPVIDFNLFLDDYYIDSNDYVVVPYTMTNKSNTDVSITINSCVFNQNSSIQGGIILTQAIAPKSTADGIMKIYSSLSNESLKNVTVSFDVLDLYSKITTQSTTFVLTGFQNASLEVSLVDGIESEPIKEVNKSSALGTLDCGQVIMQDNWYRLSSNTDLYDKIALKRLGDDFFKGAGMDMFVNTFTETVMILGRKAIVEDFNSSLAKTEAAISKLGYVTVTDELIEKPEGWSVWEYSGSIVEDDYHMMCLLMTDPENKYIYIVTIQGNSKLETINKYMNDVESTHTCAVKRLKALSEGEDSNGKDSGKNEEAEK